MLQLDLTADSDGNDSPRFLAPVGSFFEDTSAVPRTCVSISSVEDDPLAYKDLVAHSVPSSRGPSSVASYGSHSDSGDRNDTSLPCMVRCRGPAIEEIDLCVEPIGTGNTDATAGGVSQGALPLQIPLECVSRAPACKVTNIMSASRTVVLERAPGAPILDVGTLLVAACGTVLGAIKTLLGPIHACFYASIVDGTDRIDALVKDGILAEGVAVHFDTARCAIINASDVEVAKHAKGTDASFTQDDELPDGVRPDFSSDEEEKLWKLNRKQQKQQRMDFGQSKATGGILKKGELAEDNESEWSPSEAEFDDENILVRYKPRRLKRGPPQALLPSSSTATAVGPTASLASPPPRKVCRIEQQQQQPRLAHAQVAFPKENDQVDPISSSAAVLPHHPGAVKTDFAFPLPIDLDILPPPTVFESRRNAAMAPLVHVRVGVAAGILPDVCLSAPLQPSVSAVPYSVPAQALNRPPLPPHLRRAA